MSEPAPSQETVQRLNGASQPPGVTQAPKQAIKRAPGARRRLALLAATLYTPAILIGYALYQYGPMDCVAGPLCSFGAAPAVLQLALIGLGFGLLYIVGVRPLAALLDEREPARSEIVRTLRQAIHYETVRPLLAIFGALIMFTLLVGMIARTLTWPAALIGLGVMALLLWLAIAGEP